MGKGKRTEEPQARQPPPEGCLCRPSHQRMDSDLFPFWGAKYVGLGMDWWERFGIGSKKLEHHEGIITVSVDCYSFLLLLLHCCSMFFQVLCGWAPIKQELFNETETATSASVTSMVQIDEVVFRPRPFSIDTAAAGHPRGLRNRPLCCSRFHLGRKDIWCLCLVRVGPVHHWWRRMT